jgi:ABC-type transport system involved in multi-copper enzyme maturation permease subunit
MIRLLNIELKKTLNNKTFWIIGGLYALIIFIVYWGIQSFFKDVVGNISPSDISLYTFPDIWHNLTYISGYFKLILGITVVIFITNEYTYRTLRQNIITGLSRKEFLISKLLFIVFIATFATLFLYINGIILGFLNTENITITLLFKKNYFLFGYFLELVAFMTIAMFFAILIKRSGITLGVLLLYYYLIEPFLNYRLPDNIGDYLPFQAISNLIGIPPNTSLMKLANINFKEHIELSDIMITSGYIILFIYMMYFILRKRDL